MFLLSAKNSSSNSSSGTNTTTSSAQEMASHDLNLNEVLLSPSTTDRQCSCSCFDSLRDTEEGAAVAAIFITHCTAFIASQYAFKPVPTPAPPLPDQFGRLPTCLSSASLPKSARPWCTSLSFSCTFSGRMFPVRASYTTRAYVGWQLGRA